MGWFGPSGDCGCCEGDECPCHPEAWDWEVVVSGLSCTYLNATWSHTAASFVEEIAGHSGNCSLWRSTVEGDDGGTPFFMVLQVYYDGTNVRALYSISYDDPVSFVIPYGDTALETGCTKPVSKSMSTSVGTCSANLTPISVTAL